jgi:hypothetical protein
MPHTRWSILGAVLFAALPGCGSSSTTDAGTTDAYVNGTDSAGTDAVYVYPDAQNATDAPNLAIDGPLPIVTVTMPAPNSSFPYAAATAVDISVTNFNLQDFPPIGGTAPDDGHYHIYLDGADGNDYLFADYRPVAWVIIPPGTTLGAHTLRVSLRHYNHTAVGTAGADVTLPIMVTATTGPAIQITSPADNGTATQGGTVSLMLSVSNVTLVEPGGANNPAQGHYAVYLDSNSGSNTLTTVDTALMTNVTIPATTTPGPHRIRVSLRNNDSTPLGPEAAIRVNVVSM